MAGIEYVHVFFLVSLWSFSVSFRSVSVFISTAQILLTSNEVNSG